MPKDERPAARLRGLRQGAALLAVLLVGLSAAGQPELADALRPLVRVVLAP